MHRCGQPSINFIIKLSIHGIRYRWATMVTIVVRYIHPRIAYPIVVSRMLHNDHVDWSYSWSYHNDRIFLRPLFIQFLEARSNIWTRWVQHLRFSLSWSPDVAPSPKIRLKTHLLGVTHDLMLYYCIFSREQNHGGILSSWSIDFYKVVFIAYVSI